VRALNDQKKKENIQHSCSRFKKTVLNNSCNVGNTVKIWREIILKNVTLLECEALKTNL
jgi:NDP-sugar pyrophosphorylase family protein